MLSERQQSALCVAILTIWVAYAFLPVLLCADACFVDFTTVHDPDLGKLSLADTRLNTWILAWVQRALVTNPVGLFQANILYPAPNTLAGSEHLIGVALFTLPIRLFSSNAILVHQSVIVLSSLVLALCTYALALRLTLSRSIALLAGLLSVQMPWRMATIAHVQLLAAHWLPLVWLLGLRVLAGERSLRLQLAFAAVLAVQLLSSFYVAYFATLSLVLFAGSAAVFGRTSWRTLARLAAAAVPAYLLLAVAAIPYLARQAAGEIGDPPMLMDRVDLNPVVLAWRFIRPVAESAWSWSWRGSLAFDLPVLVALLALLAPLATLRRIDAAGGLASFRTGVWGLWLVSAAAFVMMLGPEIEVLGRTLPLPASWAIRFVPGYEQVRAPERWAILIGLAAPVLAAVALAALTSAAQRALGARGWRPLGSAAGAAIGLALLINVPWRQVPAAAADDAAPSAAYDALRRLPNGPVLELPWPAVQSFRQVDLETRYMLASTRHWHPILNGFTAYLPPSFFLLRRIANRLPDAVALETLSQLTGVRWIVVHTDLMGETDLGSWEELESEHRITSVYSDGVVRIYEVRASAEEARWVDRLRSGTERPRTLGDLSRDPLELRTPAGHLEIRLAKGTASRPIGPNALRVSATITNGSQSAWPGLDLFPTGLLGLRVLFAVKHGERDIDGTYSIDVDLAPGQTRTVDVVVKLPPHGGEYRACFDLVQRLEAGSVTLPMEAVERGIVVAGRKQPPGTRAARLRALAPRVQSIPWRCRPLRSAHASR